MCGLLCCDSWKEYTNLKNIHTKDYIVATSEYGFYRELINRGEPAVFMESEAKVPYEKTWEILDRIHEIVDGSKLKYFRLFHISYNIEGGFPQKIASLIINLDFIHDLVKEHNIRDIYLYDKKDNWVINESICLYAKACNLSCSIFDAESGKEKECLKTLEKWNHSVENENALYLEEKKDIDAMLKEKHEQAYSREESREEIGTLFCCSRPYEKHVNWCLKNVEAIGRDVKIICYYDTDDIRKFRDKGWSTDCVEDYFSKEAFLSKYQEMERERNIILNQLHVRLRISYRGVDLSKYLILKLTNFYFREMAQRLYMDVCAANYFQYHKFKYIRVWGDTNFWETWICHDNTRQDDTKLFKMYKNNFCNSKTRQPYENMLSAVFTPDEKLMKKHFSEDFRGKHWLIPDVVWGGKNKNTAMPSPVKNKKRAAILPTGLLSGVTTHYFYYHTLISVIDKLLEKGFEVLFKNHPGYGNVWEEDVKRKFSLNERFVAFCNQQRAEDVIGECAMVVTDLSLIAFDAADEERAVFCIVDEGGYSRIADHKEGFLIYQNPDDMIEKMETVSKDEEEFQAIIERQKQHMSKLMGDKNADVNAIIRSALESL